LEWRQCLEAAQGDHRSRLITLLTAAGVSNIGSGITIPFGGDATEVAAYAPAPGLGGQHCLDPRLEDPEAWDCDCYDEAKQLCSSLIPINTGRTSAAQCLRALYCINLRVCPAWKATFCTSEKVKEFIQELSAPSTSGQGSQASHALVARSMLAQPNLGASIQLDKSVGRKHCV